MSVTISKAELRQIAQAEIDNWRGRCMQAFGSVEFVVNETLLLMANDLHRGASVELDHLTGSRHENFQKSIASDGLFASEGALAEKQFKRWRDLEEANRNWIAHSWLRIAFDPKRVWVIKGTHIAFRK